MRLHTVFKALELVDPEFEMYADTLSGTLARVVVDASNAGDDGWSFALGEQKNERGNVTLSVTPDRLLQYVNNSRATAIRH